MLKKRSPWGVLMSDASDMGAGREGEVEPDADVCGSNGAWAQPRAVVADRARGGRPLRLQAARGPQAAVAGPPHAQPRLRRR